MFLFEAIRLGATVLHKITRKFLDDNGGGCAIGVALKAGGLAKNTDDIRRLQFEGAGEICRSPRVVAMFPIVRWLGRFISPCDDGYLGTVIQHMNDTTGMTLNQIADWLEPIERKYYEQHPEMMPKDIQAEVENVKEHADAAQAAISSRVVVCQREALRSEGNHGHVAHGKGDCSATVYQGAGGYLFRRQTTQDDVDSTKRARPCASQAAEDRIVLQATANTHWLGK